LVPIDGVKRLLTDRNEYPIGHFALTGVSRTDARDEWFRIEQRTALFQGGAQFVLKLLDLDNGWGND
jgi:hypothetical protein